MALCPTFYLVIQGVGISLIELIDSAISYILLTMKKQEYVYLIQDFTESVFFCEESFDSKKEWQEFKRKIRTNMKFRNEAFWDNYNVSARDDLQAKGKLRLQFGKDVL